MRENSLKLGLLSFDKTNKNFILFDKCLTLTTMSPYQLFAYMKKEEGLRLWILDIKKTFNDLLTTITLQSGERLQRRVYRRDWHLERSESSPQPQSHPQIIPPTNTKSSVELPLQGLMTPCVFPNFKQCSTY